MTQYSKDWPKERIEKARHLTAALMMKPDGRRVPLNFKTHDTLHNLIKEAARVSGRSMAAEIEHRLERHQMLVDLGWMRDG